MPKGKLPFLLTLIFCLSLLVSGCSLASLSHKFFNQTQGQSNLPADFVYVDQAAMTQTATAMINSAQKSIYIEQYDFDRKDLMNLLVNKAKQGVQIKVLLDQFVKSNADTYDYLRANGVDVQYYPTEKGQAARVKLLSVDGTHALIGGNDWSETAQNYHDVAIQLSDWSAWKTASIFVNDWMTATTLDLNLANTTLPNDNITLATNANIKTMLTTQLQQTKKSVQVELTQLSDSDIVNLLASMASSGKSVQVILDDSQQTANQAAIQKLLASGAAVRLYPTDNNRRLTARFGLFDDKTTLIGSANWSYISFVQNHELDLLIPSNQVTQKLSNVFAQDWKKSQAIRPAQSHSSASVKKP